MSFHRQIVTHLREAVAKDQNPLGDHLKDCTDEQVMHKLFHSFRGRDVEPKGMRLKWLGLELLSCYFRPYDITMPEDYRLGSQDLLWLDRRAKMPYYIGRGEDGKGDVRLVVFEPKLGVALKLADGMISILREAES